MQWFVFSFLFLCLVTDLIANENESVAKNKKRLLLTDPDVINQRLVHLEGTQHALKSTQQTMLQKISDLESHIQKQDKIIASHQASCDARRSNYTTERFSSENESTKRFIGETYCKGKQNVYTLFTGGGATYVRWGKSHCPNSAELVYSGYAAGQSYVTGSSARWGGPANMLCLPKDPELTNTTYAPSYSTLLGTEYETSDFAHDSAQNDVPCAVCRNAGASSSIMIPARNNCYAGWNIEYQGLLASGHRHESASSYICVDKDPEYLSGGERNENGRLLYVVNIQCVPLLCPPYHNHHKANCVVCSK